MTSSAKSREHLDRAGYLVLEDFMSPALLETLRGETERLFELEGPRAGDEFKQEPGCRRLANLVDKGDVFRQIISLEGLLSHVRHVLGEAIKLSSLNARSADPRTSRKQPLHADMGAVADSRGYWVCNTVWMLDDFTAENGSLRLVPGSHRVGKLPDDMLEDPLAPHPDEIVILGRAGTVVVINAHVWHGGLANRTDMPRLAIHAFYSRRDRPQQQYQKKLLRPEVQRRLDPQLRELLALDDPLNDPISADLTVRSGFLK